MRKIFLISAMVIFGGAAALAQDAALERKALPGDPYAPSEGAAGFSAGSGAIPALPLEVKSENGITYVTGGIGDEEMAQLKAQQGNFNVQVLLTAQHGEYLGEALARVIGADGADLAVIENAGPYVYVQLKPGSYTFEVTAKEGGIRKFEFTVPPQHTVKQVLRFSE